MVQCVLELPEAWWPFPADRVVERSRRRNAYDVRTKRVRSELTEPANAPHDVLTRTN